jgi:GT2 family glycosyltransferase
MLKISLVIVCYNERNNIKECLDSVVSMDYPQNSFEIILVDNDSTDGTKEIIGNYINKYNNIRMIVNPIKGIAGSRNLGLKNAIYDYVAFTDADCIVKQDWLQKLSNGFEKYGADSSSFAGVGGSNVPPFNNSRIYSALRIFLTTYLGSHGSVQAMTFSKDQVVDHIPTINILYLKEKVKNVGGFDISFGNIGEDQDLSYKLNKAGFKYMYLADNEVYHKLRPSFNKWLKNMFVYGKGRIWLLKKHPNRIKFVLLMPALLVAVLPLTLLGIWFPVLFLPLFYFPLIMFISFIECLKRKQLNYFLDLFCLYIGTHLAYGLGEWKGLFKKREMFRLISQKELLFN